MFYFLVTMFTYLLWFCHVQYHGGTNFERTSGGPLISTSYDYDAPIDEYGEDSPPLDMSFFSSWICSCL